MVDVTSSGAVVALGVVTAATVADGVVAGARLDSVAEVGSVTVASIATGVVSASVTVVVDNSPCVVHSLFTRRSTTSFLGAESPSVP